eukprot:TRINITY_DN4091_c0_g1_i1.p1 TRINITY_DN4091_c0_g1~~TRINITY_DN4091_c0_g1_i1.p1  ORF type:complete len:252 (-),score=34.68 TRINITY_DN4091_c0_g1_i1:545-1300(-)
MQLVCSGWRRALAHSDCPVWRCYALHYCSIDSSGSLPTEFSSWLNCVREVAYMCWDPHDSRVVLSKGNRQVRLRRSAGSDRCAIVGNRDLAFGFDHYFEFTYLAGAPTARDVVFGVANSYVREVALLGPTTKGIGWYNGGQIFKLGARVLRNDQEIEAAAWQVGDTVAMLVSLAPGNETVTFYKDRGIIVANRVSMATEWSGVITTARPSEARGRGSGLRVVCILEDGELVVLRTYRRTLLTHSSSMYTQK